MYFTSFILLHYLYIYYYIHYKELYFLPIELKQQQHNEYLSIINNVFNSTFSENILQNNNDYVIYNDMLSYYSAPWNGSNIVDQLYYLEVTFLTNIS